MANDDARRQPPAEGTEWLDIRVGELMQLFNAMDPAPFRERDIDPNAETYIFDWAQEVRAGRPLGLVVHLARERAAPEAASMLRESVDILTENRKQYLCFVSSCLGGKNIRNPKG